jgi:sarcosine oxidase
VGERRGFVVVGAGLVGLAATRELALRGRDVVCIEQATIGHERAGSKGTSRIFRYGYDDPFYVRMAMRSLAGWGQLGEEYGQRLLEPTGLLSFGNRVHELADAMEEGGAAYEMLMGEEIAERFPAIHVAGNAVFEATAGVLHADEVLSALAHSAAAAGAEILEGVRVSGVADGEDAVRVRAGALEYDCAATVLCGGAWSGELGEMAGLATRDIFRPSLQQVAYLQPKSGSLHGVPAVVERGPVTCYGVPTPARGQYKIGIHDPSGTVQPGEISLDDDPAALELLRSAALRSLPGFFDEPAATERCFYDNTPDEHFVIDRVGHVVIGAGTSGHGFKFGPVWAEVLADLAEGAPPSVPLERFSLRRFR